MLSDAPFILLRIRHHTDHAASSQRETFAYCDYKTIVGLALTKLSQKIELV